jgi:hypothetical protein
MPSLMRRTAGKLLTPLCVVSGKIIETEFSSANLPFCVIVAGFQNIADTDPPAATPA